MRNTENLLPHNRDVYGRAASALAEANSLCIVEGMGVGKSFVFLALMDGPLVGKRVLFIAPKECIWHNLGRYEGFAAVQGRLGFASFQSFRSEDRALAAYEAYDAFVIDEAHHLGSDVCGRSLLALLGMCRKGGRKPFIGLTATPIRDTDGVDVTRFFDRRVDGLTTFDAIEVGLMPQVEYIACSTDISDEERRAFRERLDIQLSSPLLDEVVRDNPKDRWMVFFTDIQSLLDGLATVKVLFPGHRLIRVTSDVKGSQKELDGIAEGEKVVVVSVDMLLEGLHLPHMQGILLFRRVQSLTVFTQVFGRITAIGETEPPLFVDCTDTAYRLLRKLMSCHAEKAGVHPSNAERRPVLATSLQNRKYLDIAELLHLLRENGRPVELDGKRYPSIGEACRTLGVSYSKVVHRIGRHGEPAEDAIRWYLEKRDKVRVGDAWYDGIRNACQALGAPYKAVMRLLDKDESLTPEAAINSVIARRVTAFGRQYKDLAECCREHGARLASVRALMEEGLTAEAAIQEAKSLADALRRKKPVVFRGIAYESQIACLRALGLTQGDGCYVRFIARRDGLPWTEALDAFLQKREEQKPAKKEKPKPKDTSFVFRGEAYSSFRDACRAFGLKDGSVSSYASKHGVSKEAAMEAALDDAPRFVFRGEGFSSAKECCERYGLSQSVVSHVVYREKKTWQEVIEMALAGKLTPGSFQVTVGGVTYKTAKEACAGIGASYGTLSGRVRALRKKNPNLGAIEAWERVLAEDSADAEAMN